MGILHEIQAGDVFLAVLLTLVAVGFLFVTRNWSDGELRRFFNGRK